MLVVADAWADANGKLSLVWGPPRHIGVTAVDSKKRLRTQSYTERFVINICDRDGLHGRIKKGIVNQ